MSRYSAAVFTSTTVACIIKVESRYLESIFIRNLPVYILSFPRNSSTLSSCSPSLLTLLALRRDGIRNPAYTNSAKAPSSIMYCMNARTYTLAGVSTSPSPSISLPLNAGVLANVDRSMYTTRTARKGVLHSARRRSFVASRSWLQSGFSFGVSERCWM